LLELFTPKITELEGPIRHREETITSSYANTSYRNKKWKKTEQ